MEVCHVIDNMSVGGAQHLLLDIVEHSPNDISHTICSLEEVDTSGAETNRDVKNFDARFKFDPLMLSRLARFLMKRTFDIVHLHLPYSQGVSRLPAKIGGAAVVGTYHNVRSNYHPVLRLIENITRPLEDMGIAVSDGVRESYDNRSMKTIYNGIDVDAFHKSVEQTDAESFRYKCGITEDSILCLNVGRYREVKKQSDLILAMRELPEDINAHLAIVGWGPLEDELQDLVEQLNLSNQVTVTGKVDNINEAYAAGDIFVSSSKMEGLPLTHIEAMSSSLPIISTNIPGVTEVVSEEYGSLVSVGEPDRIAEKIVELIRERNMNAMGARGLNHARCKFDISGTVQSYTEIYREATCKS